MSALEPFTRSLSMVYRSLTFLGVLLSIFSVAPQANAYWEHEQVDEILIDRPAPQVFTFATTAEHWSEWHPSTIGTEGADDHPARIGEEILEHVADPSGAAATINWVVTEFQFGHHWQIVGVSGDGFWDFEITYEFIPQPGGRTLWRRTLIFGTAVPFPADVLAYLVYYMDQVSGVAVANFKALIESLPRPWWRQCGN